ncbi:uncharacterized protein LOC8262049 isoform X2 [Ricinus communis]|uniref:uncharacterized protein LOC8262049 isoform X2 n=1 Tax=Ricinus communis TaxID=3988 RepID=UPI000D6A0055|nr:uncharacterized protein LOC8262049 isoform X2 [Ricinus communis]|eukprot:XP_025012894.1 uncharacterized protein LOC8262049 isoform X2 [Ricinus communis]
MEKLNDGVADKDLIKFLSCQDLTSICTIEQAEKLIECMDHKALEISKKLEARKRDEYSIYRRRNDESLRCEVAYDKDKLDYLQLALDKLSFANNAYYDRPIKSCLFEDEVHFNNLHFLLLHGSKSLAEEKKLIRETKKGKQKGPVGSCSTLGMLNASIWGLICQSYHCSYSIDEVQYRKIIEEMNQLKCIREKAIANAAVKGRIWNSLGSKETIQDEVKESKIEVK